MKILSASDIRDLIDYSGLIEFFRSAHQHARPPAVRHILESPTHVGDQFACLSGWRPDGLIVTKLVGIFPGNPQRHPPLPSTPGLVIAFSGETGVPLAAADGAELTFSKTAADSALAAKLLARPNSSTLLLVGAGNLGPHMVRAHLAAQTNLREVHIWNRTPQKAELVADQLRKEGIDAHIAADLDSAVAQADIITCVTMSDTPLVKGHLLKPGTHLDLVGAYLPTLREADDAAVLNSQKYADTIDGALQAGDFSQLVEQGKMTAADIRADLFQLCQGSAPGRSSADEITLFKNNGGGHLDLFAMEYIVGRM